MVTEQDVHLPVTLTLKGDPGAADNSTVHFTPAGRLKVLICLHTAELMERQPLGVQPCLCPHDCGSQGQPLEEQVGLQAGVLLGVH